ncbi:MAG: hypothetical protein IPG50_18400 [Myxococcales bacterium]|nr:hypothetical protein [Myxococcales bacterium]
MMGAVRHAPVAVAALTATALAACSLLNSLDGYSEPRPADAAPGADASDGSAPECVPARVPPVPTTGPGLFNTGPPVIFALRSFDFAEQDGLDLDNRCTSCGDSPSAPTCVNTFPGATCAPDGPFGIDNRGGALLAPFLKNLIGGSLNLDNGAYGLVFRLDDWSRERLASDGGAPVFQDRAVKLSLISSTLGLAFDADGGRPLRRNDGSDRWSVDALRPQGNTSKEAYITDDILYARFEDLSFHVGPLRIEWTEAQLRARIVDVGTHLRIEEGIIAARAPTSGLLLGLARYLATFGYCTDEVYLGETKKTICPAADLPSRAVDDGRGLACDAISYGVTITADQAQEGPTVSDADAGLFPCGPDFRPSCP